MVFQPTSPVQLFQRRSSKSREIATKSVSSVNHTTNMSSSSESVKIDQCAGSGAAIKPLSMALSDTETITVTEPFPDLEMEPEPHQPHGTINMDPYLPEVLKQRRESIGTTNSSPTDPAFVPVLKLKPNATTAIEVSEGSTNPAVIQEPQSFFESDTEDETPTTPVVSRATSIRATRPSVIRHISGARNKLQSNRLPKDAGTAETTVSFVGDSQRNRMSRISELDTDRFKDNEAVEAVLRRLNGEFASLDEVSMQAFPPSPRLSIKSPARSVRIVNPDQPVEERRRVDGLRSNPLTSMERTMIQRAMSAPTPHRRLPAKVRIRPSDLVIVHPKDNSRLFRETVVSTPYPTAELEDDTQIDEKDGSDQTGTARPRSDDGPATAEESGDIDRFPSPNRPEILFLELGLAKHPGVVTTLEIKIIDKGRYDDEMLFRQIRSAYCKTLLGVSRVLFRYIRILSYATVTNPFDTDFDGANFTKHFHHPHLGHKRKSWVIWLRQQNKTGKSARSTTSTPLKHVSVRMSPAEKRNSTQSDSSTSNNFSFLPSWAFLHIPFINHHDNSPAHASTRESTSPVSDEGGIETVKVELHHDFSFWTLALFSILVVFSSLAAVVLWTVFGVPGTRPGGFSKISPPYQGPSAYAWNEAAQGRVLVGLVLGLLVLLLGALVEACTMFGAWVLL